MACNQTLAGLVNDCLPSMGGIAEIYIANAEDVTEVTVSENEVTGITMNAEAKFKKYYFKPQTGSFTSTLNKNAQNGTNYVSTDIVLQFTRMETTKRVEIAALSVNDLVCIVKDMNGVYWYFGYEHPVTAGSGDGQTGTARDDANRYQITLQDVCSTWPYEVLVGDGGVDLATIVG